MPPLPCARTAFAKRVIVVRNKLKSSSLTISFLATAGAAARAEKEFGERPILSEEELYGQEHAAEIKKP